MKRNKFGKFAKELDNAAMIKFYDNYEKKEILREEAIRRSVSESSICREWFGKFIKSLRK